ncbi:rod shape-determining protein MreC [Tistlia consotensis]|uniref:Cell shape-determining protein MreC n=1 Tax=Tistlia consotensis USBA 355 TaxID=560819 RepID=A0A1Y6B4C6_9PROT|nr:rod shape-determining protein MreC [Tistlia consotensis]SME91275.1 rod shape-determining protein MreC [Tistlia consotensis USBA 355]SNR27254.1 rod shape-determining protein MreC [Tistlia consotensis]
MNKRTGKVVRLATPLKAWTQRFAFLLLVGAAFGLMLLGKIDTVLIERARTQLADAMAPLLDAASEPVATVNGTLEDMRDLARMREVNAMLRAENQRLLDWRRSAIALAAQNAALRDLMKLAPDAEQRYVTARVVADQGNAFVRSVLVAVGKSAGVDKGQAALTGSGLAGRVVEVGDKISRILLITDINSRIPVAVGAAGDKAILAGDNSPKPSLMYLLPNSSVKVGDRVVTSGNGGLFPPGLPVGEVTEVADGSVRVRPYVDWEHLDYLRLVGYDLPGLIADFIGKPATAR